MSGERGERFVACGVISAESSRAARSASNRTAHQLVSSLSSRMVSARARVRQDALKGFASCTDFLGIDADDGVCGTSSPRPLSEASRARRPVERRSQPLRWASTTPPRATRGDRDGRRVPPPAAALFGRARPAAAAASGGVGGGVAALGGGAEGGRRVEGGGVEGDPWFDGLLLDGLTDAPPAPPRPSWRVDARRQRPGGRPDGASLALRFGCTCGIA